MCGVRDTTTSLKRRIIFILICMTYQSYVKITPAFCVAALVCFSAGKR